MSNDNLFDESSSYQDKNSSKKAFQPLAERMRPNSFDDFIGQKHLLGEDGVIRKLMKLGNIPSMVLWGTPGTGKTTLALLLAKEINFHFFKLSAIDAGVKDIREVIKKAEALLKSNKKSILFIDEIHRFSKSQQDALLHSVEVGVITLIGATTENPSFEVNPALLSRCRVFKLKELSDDDIIYIIKKAISFDEIFAGKVIEFQDINTITRLSGGDARTALNLLEASMSLLDPSENILSNSIIEIAAQQKIVKFDKAGENHYDTISAFIKSMRGSDPDAAIFWLAKMIEGGEDPKFIARRMIVFASEDIGNADLNALRIALDVFRSVEVIGLPEARIVLCQGVAYLSAAPKSNASYLAIESALSDIRNGANDIVPLHLRNAPTKTMLSEGYSIGYKYPHDFQNSFVEESYFPDTVRHYYHPKGNGTEEKIINRLKLLWKNRYDEK